MSKVVKLAISIFVGADIFVLVYLLLSQGRFALFGTGDIPGGGSALDMALFLIPAFIAYVTGDRLYHFLSYNQRRSNSNPPGSNSNPAKKSQAQVELEQTKSPAKDSIWQDKDWEEAQTDVDKTIQVSSKQSSES